MGSSKPFNFIKKTIFAIFHDINCCAAYEAAFVAGAFVVPTFLFMTTMSLSTHVSDQIMSCVLYSELSSVVTELVKREHV